MLQEFVVIKSYLENIIFILRQVGNPTNVSKWASLAGKDSQFWKLLIPWDAINGGSELSNFLF